MTWTEFAIAGAFFLLTHRVPTIPSVRAALVDQIGERGFVVSYSLLSLVMLTWLIVASGRAPYVELWPVEPWQAWVPIVSMPIACLFLAFSIAVPNPLSFSGGDAAAFHPERPGFVGFARHGLLWALAIWSAAHIPPNGNVAHVILFGTFAAFSIVGMAMIDRRKRRQLGPAEWVRLSANTSFWPGQSFVMGRWAPTGSVLTANHAVRLVCAACLYAILIGSHAWIIGVSPWPW